MLLSLPLIALTFSGDANPGGRLKVLSDGLSVVLRLQRQEEAS